MKRIGATDVELLIQSFLNFEVKDRTTFDNDVCWVPDSLLASSVAVQTMWADWLSNGAVDSRALAAARA